MMPEADRSLLESYVTHLQRYVSLFTDDTSGIGETEQFLPEDDEGQALAAALAKSFWDARDQALAAGVRIKAQIPSASSEWKKLFGQLEHALEQLSLADAGKGSSKTTPRTRSS